MISGGSDPLVQLVDYDRPPGDGLPGKLSEHRSRVCPPLTAKWKRPLAAAASRARAATNAAPARATASGPAGDSRSWCMPGLRLLLAVAAELAAHRREDLVGELAKAARLEPLLQ